MTARRHSLVPATAGIVLLAVSLAGCESVQITKRIDYKSTASAPALELPPDLTTPRYDDRYTVTTASGVAAQQTSGKARESQTLLTVPDARIARAGNERWLVVKATPDQAWNMTRAFWSENGFVLTTEQPALGVMETDWAENRAEIPQDVLRRTVGKFVDIFYTTYKRDKFRARIERGVETGTVEIYVSHRGMEQVPTGKIDNSSPAAFAWALMPPNPDLEAEMLTRLMVKFGRPSRRRSPPSRRPRRSPSARASRRTTRGFRSSWSTRRSIARGVASASRSTAAGSRSSIAIAATACTSFAIRIPTPTSASATRAGSRSSRSGARTRPRSPSSTGSPSSSRRRAAS
jgi:hypothetical protein